jgi:hypothetical protein
VSVSAIVGVAADERVGRKTGSLLHINSGRLRMGFFFWNLNGKHSGAIEGA